MVSIYRQRYLRHDGPDYDPDSYLRARPMATFDPDDFDSLSSKFVSKLLIRAN